MWTMPEITDREMTGEEWEAARANRKKALRSIEKTLAGYPFREREIILKQALDEIPSAAHRDTLRYIRDREVCAAWLAEQMCIKQTAASNRLSDLERMGLVTRTRKDGRVIMFKATQLAMEMVD